MSSLHEGRFKLFCYILGESVPPFSVNIVATETVGDLKDEIMSKIQPITGNVVAAQLKLWKVNLQLSPRTDSRRYGFSIVKRHPQLLRLN